MDASRVVDCFVFRTGLRTGLGIQHLSTVSHWRPATSHRARIPHLDPPRSVAQRILTRSTHNLKSRRALLTERTWILQSWLLKAITGQTHVTYNWCQHSHAFCTRRLVSSQRRRLHPLAGSTLNIVTVSRQLTSSCHTVPATALILCMHM